ncbi:MAG: hypothetical protein WEA09_06190 [Gemmatimonadota bacterium]
MRRRGFRPGLILVALALSACDSGEPAGDMGVARDTLPGGTPLVVNQGGGIWGPEERWTLEEEWRVGSVEGEGPAVFTWLNDLALDAQGTAYLVDGSTREIRVFDPQGVWIRTMGGEGAGPGEFRNVNGLTFGPDGTLWVSDPGNGRYARFSAEGELLGTHPRTLGFFSIPWMGGMTRDGVLWDQGMVPGEGAPQGRHALLRLDSSAQPVDTFPVPIREPELFVLEGLMTVTVPFTPTTVWLLDPGGDVWIGDNDRYRIHRVALPGWDTVAAMERHSQPLAVTPEAQEAALENLAFFTEQGGQVDLSRIPSTMPHFIQLVPDDGDHLWVVPPGALGGRTFDTLDVFDPEGAFLGTVATPVPLALYPSPVIQGDRLVGITLDELEVQYLVSLRIRGR